MADDRSYLSAAALSNAQATCLKLLDYYNQKRRQTGRPLLNANGDEILPPQANGATTPDGATHKEVAEALGCFSRERARQVEKQALNDLRHGAKLNDPRLQALRTFYEDEE